MHSEVIIMIELYQLEQLVTIAKAGTISKAAEILLISQPGLTRSIQRLEDELGLKLFDRKKNKITLNDNGIMAVEYAKKILDETDKMVKQLQSYDLSKRTISIGSCAPAPNWGLTYIFKQLYPAMKITDSLDSNEDNLLSGLDNHEYSIIAINHPINDDNRICIPLFEEHLYLSVPPAHPLALFKEISFRDLNGESVLLLSRIGFWNEICLKMIPESHLLIQEDDAIFEELTKASALPNFRSNLTLLREKENNNRINIPISDPEAHVQYYAVYNKNNRKMFDPIKDEITNIDWAKTAIILHIPTRKITINKLIFRQTGDYDTVAREIWIILCR